MTLRVTRGLAVKAALLGLGATSVFAQVPTRIQSLQLSPLTGPGSASSLVIQNPSASSGIALDVNVGNGAARLQLSSLGELLVGGASPFGAAGLTLAGTTTLSGLTNINTGGGNAATNIGYGGGGDVTIQSGGNITLNTFGGALGLSSTDSVGITAVGPLMLTSLGDSVGIHGPAGVTITALSTIDIYTPAPLNITGDGTVTIASQAPINLNTAAVMNLTSTSGPINLNSTGGAGISLQATTGPLNLTTTGTAPIQLVSSGTGHVILDPGANATSELIFNNIDNLVPAVGDRILYITATGLVRATDGAGSASNGITFEDGQYQLGGANTLTEDRTIGVDDTFTLGVNGAGSFNANMGGSVSLAGLDSVDISSLGNIGVQAVGPLVMSSTDSVGIAANSLLTMTSGGPMSIYTPAPLSIIGNGMLTISSQAPVDINTAAIMTFTSTGGPINMNSASTIGLTTTAGPIMLNSTAGAGIFLNASGGNGPIRLGSNGGDVILDPSAGDVVLNNIVALVPAAGDRILYITNNGEVRGSDGAGSASNGITFEDGQYQLGGANSVIENRTINVESSYTLTIGGAGTFATTNAVLNLQSNASTTIGSLGIIDVSSSSSLNLSGAMGTTITGNNMAGLMLNSDDHITLTSTGASGIEIRSLGNANGDIIINADVADLRLLNIPAATPGSGDVPLFLTSNGEVRVGTAGGFAAEGIQFANNQYELGGNPITTSRSLSVNTGITLGVDGPGSFNVGMGGGMSLSSTGAAMLSTASTLTLSSGSSLALNSIGEIGTIDIGNANAGALNIATGATMNITSDDDGSVSSNAELAIGGATALSLNGGSETGTINMGNALSGAVNITGGSSFMASTVGNASLFSNNTVTLSGSSATVGVNINTVTEPGAINIGNSLGGQVKIIGTGTSSFWTYDAADNNNTAVLNMNGTPGTSGIDLSFSDLTGGAGGISAGAAGAPTAVLFATDGSSNSFTLGYDAASNYADLNFLSPTTTFNLGFNGIDARMDITDATNGYANVTLSPAPGDGVSGAALIVSDGTQTYELHTPLAGTAGNDQYEMPDDPGVAGDVLTIDNTAGPTKLAWTTPANPLAMFHARGVQMGNTTDDTYTITDANILATDIVMVTGISGASTFTWAITGVTNGSFTVNFSTTLSGTDGFYYMVIPQ